MPRITAPVWFAGHLLLMVALHVAWPVDRWNLGMTRWWGLPFALAGAALVVASASRFAGRTTLRPDGTPAELVTEGPFRYSRNPMYVGMLAALLGGWIMLGSLTPGLALPHHRAHGAECRGALRRRVPELPGPRAPLAVAPPCPPGARVIPSARIRFERGGS